MIRVLTMCVFGWVTLAVGACHPGAIETGAIQARWTLSPMDCESLHIATVEARALRDGVVVASASQACSDEGILVLEGLDPASYTVEIEGFNAETPPRGTHMERQENVEVLEGSSPATMELRLVEKTGRVHVRWKFPNGLQCVDNGVSLIKVGLFDEQNKALAQDTVACDVSFTDPLDQVKKSGVLFEGLVAGASLILIVEAFDAEDTKLLTGTDNIAELFPGDTQGVIITLE